MISPQVIQELLTVRQVLHYLPASPKTEHGWTPQEQDLFWVALNKFPQGPWTVIAGFIGTKSTRQAMTHGQKLRQKLNRWKKRLRRTPAMTSLMLQHGLSVDNINNSGSSPLTPPIMTTTFPSGAPCPHNSGPNSPQYHHQQQQQQQQQLRTSPYQPQEADKFEISPKCKVDASYYDLEPQQSMSYMEMLAATVPLTTAGIITSSAMTTASSHMTRFNCPPVSVVPTSHSVDLCYTTCTPTTASTVTTIATAATIAPSMPVYDDNDVHLLLPQSMVDDLAGVIWD